MKGYVFYKQKFTIILSNYWLIFTIKGGNIDKSNILSLRKTFISVETENNKWDIYDKVQLGLKERNGHRLYPTFLPKVTEKIFFFN